MTRRFRRLATSGGQDLRRMERIRHKENHMIQDFFDFLLDVAVGASCALFMAVIALVFVLGCVGICRAIWWLL